MPKPSHASSFQLLEVNLVSAQDLPEASASMRTFAVAWINPKRKLTTRVDNNGHTNPTWNEKFVFRVDDDFLKDDTSKIMIEIYASAWLRDILIGTASIVVNNIENTGTSKMRFTAIQLRRASGRPQGILNAGLVVLDSSRRSMPLCSELSSSAIGYQDLMDSKSNNQKSSNNGSKMEGKIHALYRSKSERSTSDYGFSKSSICSAAHNNHSKKGPGSICIESSIVNGSEISDTTNPNDHDGVTLPKKEEAPKKSGTLENNNATRTIGIVNGVNGSGSVVTMSLCSDIGPSPSVVAAAIAKGIYPLPGRGANTETESSVMDEWADEDSVEGLNTKINRWRTEMPPMYDATGNLKSSEHENNMKMMMAATSKHQKTSRAKKKGRSRSSGGSLFSCFALGCEISISCGGGGKGKKPKKRSSGKARSEITYNDDSYL